MRGLISRRFQWTATFLLFAVLAGIAWLGWGPSSKPPAIRQVVLISIDTCRSDYLGCYGAQHATTPHVDQLARQATLFENVVSPVPMTLPAHSSMLTGTNPTYHDVHDNLNNRLSPANLTLPEVLRGNGFTTGAIVSSSVLDSRFGLDQGFDEYLDTMTLRSAQEESAERPGGATTEMALRWLEQQRAKPFFLLLHYYDPHEAYAPPEPFASRFAEAPYAGEIAYVDDCIGQVIDKLKELGLFDTTLLIITGDHGEMLGEHGERYHGFFIYQSALRVPLIMRMPGQHAGRRVKELVGLIDIVPTICSLLDVDRPPVLQGIDLAPALRGEALELPQRSLYCESFQATRYEANSLLGLVTEQWKYIQTTRPELYELPQDPREGTNLAADSPTLLLSLRKRLQQTIQEQNRHLADSRLQLDDATRRRLESLGYVGTRQDATSLSADYNQDPAKEDPKDLIGFFDQHVQLTILLGKKQYDEARKLCQQMMAQRPQSWIPYSYLADIALEQGDPVAAESNLREVLARKGPDHAEAHNRLGILRLSQERPDEAIAELQQAVKLRPDFQGAWFNLGTAWEAKGQLTDAVTAYRQALAADPEFIDAHLKLAATLQTQGNFDEALEHYRQALKIDPTSRAAQYNLAMTLLRLDRSTQAVQELRKAVQLAPDWPIALGSLAWVLSTSPEERIRNAHEAVPLAEQAARLTDGRDPLILDVLAASYAAAGRFPEAITTVQSAIDLATASGAQRLADSCRQRLHIYQRQQPYREPRRSQE